jgi:hypothetical protein
MAKKKKKSGWTLKPGQSVEDWLDDRRARDRSKLPVEQQSRALIRAFLGYADDEDDDDSVKKEDAPVQAAA